MRCTQSSECIESMRPAHPTVSTNTWRRARDTDEIRSLLNKAIVRWINELLARKPIQRGMVTGCRSKQCMNTMIVNSFIIFLRTFEDKHTGLETLIRLGINQQESCQLWHDSILGLMSLPTDSRNACINHLMVLPIEKHNKTFDT